MKARGFLYCALTTTLNLLLYVLSFGTYLWLEGRVRNGVFSNWVKRYRYRPGNFFQPRTQDEIIKLIKSSTGVRVFGGGHSFNGGVVADQTLLSLDKYNGVIWKDLEKKQFAVKAGTRVREISRLLLEHGLAFEALPTHDAQSIGGILSTDVHGTGRDLGFVSQQVVKLKLIDGTGQVYECGPDDDLFRAAVGGTGAVGIITEVVVQAVDRFNVEQKLEVSSWSFVKQNLDDLLNSHAHLSIYLFPFSDRCHINTWNPTPEKQSPLAPLREFITTSLDALSIVWFANLVAHSRLLPRLSDLSLRTKRGTDLVMESYQAFNRTIYYLHQELEFAVPYENTVEVCERFIHLFESMYRQRTIPFTLLEVRFTPKGHDRTLIGPGRERRSMWLDLLTNDSRGYEEFYAAAERLLKEMNARPHPGKFNESFTKADLLRLHGDQMVKFLQLVDQHDPERKFANAFTRRLYGE
jgi:hypothetical protein